MSDAQIEEKIRVHRDALIKYVYEAFRRKLHEKKGYANFRAYLQNEFQTPYRTAYDVTRQAQVMFELSASTEGGDAAAPNVSARAAKAILPRLPEAKERVASGEAPESVIRDMGYPRERVVEEYAARAPEPRAGDPDKIAEVVDTERLVKFNLLLSRALDQARQIVNASEQLPLDSNWRNEFLSRLEKIKDKYDKLYEIFSGTRDFETELEGLREEL
jgi:uncharacterized protein (DUF1778 family)